MAQDSWPSPNHNSRAVTDAEYESIAARFSDDGVDGSPADTAVCSAGAGLQVVVRSGLYASVRGHAWYSGSVDDTLTIASNSSGSTRVDRVVLQMDRSTRDVRAVVVAGTPGAGVPALTRDAGTTGVWEVPLAQVTVPDGAASVTVTRDEQYIGTRVRPCTSTTRPPVPRRGEQVFETDTGVLRMWSGSSWVTVYEDSGEVALGAGWSAWAAAGNSVGRSRGGVVTLRLARRLVGARLEVENSTGSKVATVPAALRPIADAQYFAGQFAGGHPCRVEVRTDGEVWVRALSNDVPTGNTLLLTMTYVRW